MKSRERKRKKGEAFLIRVAESIGSTMGTIAGRANAAQKPVTQSPVARTVKRKGKKLVGKSKKAKTIMPADLKRRKLARATGRGLRRPNSSAKRALRGYSGQSSRRTTSQSEKVTAAQDTSDNPTVAASTQSCGKRAGRSAFNARTVVRMWRGHTHPYRLHEQRCI